MSRDGRNKIEPEMVEDRGDWRAEADAALEAEDPAKAKARRRGRPKGAMNRKTQELAAWYQAQGYRDPLQAMAEFLSADPVGIQAFFAKHETTLKAIGKVTGLAVPSLGEIVKMQMDCAAELAPYLHGKAPIRVDVVDERLPFLVINAGTNQLDQARAIAEGRGLSVGSKINDLAPVDPAQFHEVPRDDEKDK